MFAALIGRKILLAVVLLIVVVLGSLGALQVPVQMIPDLEVRTVSVETRWPGATPQDVEKEILIEQEEFLRTVPNLQRMLSSASTGSASIELEFPFGVDIEQTLIRVSNALSQVSGYPENVDEPRIVASSFSSNAFMFFSITPLPGNPQAVDMDLMGDLVEDFVRPRLERVPGVAQVSVRGAAERQVQIIVDPTRLAQRGISLTQLRDSIRARNRDFSGGDIDSDKRRYLIRTVGRMASVAEFADLIVAERDGALVRLRDVATVSLDHGEIRSRAFSRGQPSITLAVNREAGSNVIDIKAAMLPAVQAVNLDLLAAKGLEIRLISDDVRYVQDSIRNIWINLALGAVLAMAVLLAFSGSLPNTLIAIVGVPLCALAAFLALSLTGRTINVISLAGVAFALGMTLDNTIVVLESIERKRREGMAAARAAVDGVAEVWPAVLASTLTTVLVFAPLLFIVEEAGQLYSDVAIAISGAITASMLYAVAIVPAATTLLRGTRRNVPWADRLEAQIAQAVAGLIGSKPKRVATIAVTSLLTLSAAYWLTPPAEYLPEGEEPKTFSRLIAPPGYNLPEMLQVAKQVEAQLLPHVDADDGDFVAGKTDVPPLSSLLVSVSAGSVTIISETINPAHIDALMDAIDKRYRAFPGMRAFSSRGSIISSNDGGTRSVNLDISGPRLEDIYTVAEAAFRRAEQAFENPRIGSTPSSLVLAQPLIELRPRWDRAAELGFSAAELGYTISALSDGAFVDEFLLDGDKLDIYLYGKALSNQRIEALPDLPVATPSGQVLPLSALVDFVDTVDTESVRRVNGRRTVTLNIIPPRAIPLETGVSIVQAKVMDALSDEGAIPAGVTMELSGAADQLDATRNALSGNFLVAVLLCYLLLVAIFSHFGMPLLILTSVPLGIAGGIIGLAVLNIFVRQPFDVITMLGFLILVGTVVNNPILIVSETMKHLQRRGGAAVDAVRSAVSARLRPMLVSTLTTLVGLAPLVFIPGAGTELYRGVGAIVLFGLLCALLISLSFLPALLTLLLKDRPQQGLAGAEARVE